MKNKKIIYVNYSPYENMGYTLDFLTEEYEYVFLFSIGHHDLGKGRRSNKLAIYRKGEIEKEIYLYHLYTSSQFVFTFLPIRSLVNLYQIIWHCYLLNRKYGHLDYYFSTNGFVAWIGLVVKSWGLVEKTIYWVWDYYPIKHENKAIQSMRWLYWQFEKRTTSSDILAFHNTRVVEVWKKHGLLPKRYVPVLVQAGTNKIQKTKIKLNPISIRLCFLGVLKRSMGLDYLFDSTEALSEAFPNLIIEIIGPGPDEKYFKGRAKGSPIKINFHGYLDENDMDRLISNCTIGIAPYMPDSTNVSFYADSAKMKKYISLGLPIIATKIHEVADEIEKVRGGVMIQYGDEKGLVKAIKKIISNYKFYKKNVEKLNERYYYKNNYTRMFEFD